MARGQGDEQQAPPVFHGSLGGATAASLSGGCHPEPHSWLIQPDEQGAGGWAGGHLALNLLLAHAQPAPRTPQPPRARPKLLPVDLC